MVSDNKQKKMSEWECAPQQKRNNTSNNIANKNVEHAGSKKQKQQNDANSVEGWISKTMNYMCDTCSVKGQLRRERARGGAKQKSIAQHERERADT